MACDGCLNVIDRPVVLISGDVVCHTCPRWREECEVRHVAGLPDDERMEYIGRVRLKRGALAADHLDAQVTAWDTNNKGARR